jgi:hypothetical protein
LLLRLARNELDPHAVIVNLLEVETAGAQRLFDRVFALGHCVTGLAA